jgi:hypothetical protein
VVGLSSPLLSEQILLENLFKLNLKNLSSTHAYVKLKLREQEGGDVATATQRAAIAEIFNNAKESLERELREIRARYGDNVREVHSCELGFWHYDALKNREVGIFHRTIIRTIVKEIRRDPTQRSFKPFRVVFTSNHGDAVLFITETDIHFRYYGEYEDFSQPWYIRLYPAGRKYDRHMRANYSVATAPFADEAINEMWYQTADRINSTAPSPLGYLG